MQSPEQMKQAFRDSRPDSTIKIKTPFGEISQSANLLGDEVDKIFERSYSFVSLHSTNLVVYQELIAMKEEISTFRSEISDIKQMLTAMLALEDEPEDDIEEWKEEEMEEAEDPNEQ